MQPCPSAWTVLQTPRTCPHRKPSHDPESLQPEQPSKLLQTPGCTCPALQCLYRGTWPLGNSGICAGPAIPIKLGFVLTETSQTKQEASRSLSTRPILHFTRGFGQHSQGFRGRTSGSCPNHHRRTQELIQAPQHPSPGQAMQSHTGLSGCDPVERPTAAHSSSRRAPGALQGLVFGIFWI